MTKKAVIIGAGIVGKATAKTLTIPYEFHDPDKGLHADYQGADYVFVCIPTPEVFVMKSLEALEIRTIIQYLSELQTNRFVCVRSTAVLQLAKYKNEGFPDNVCIWPEFLRERSWEEDAVNSSTLVVGLPYVEGRRYDPETEVSKRFMQTLREITIFDDFHFTDKRTAVIMKLATNSFFATKVHFANLLWNLCKSERMNYDDLKEALILDPRMGTDHWDVPGPDGYFGYGGKCLPKDLKALGSQMAQSEVNTNFFGMIKGENDLNRTNDGEVLTPDYTGKIVFAKIREETFGEEAEFFRNKGLIRMICNNLNNTGRNAVFVNYRKCIEKKEPFNFIIEAVPFFTHEYYTSRYAEFKAAKDRVLEDYFDKLDKYFKVIIPDLLPLIRAGLCRLFFVTNENPAMNENIYTFFGKLFEKHGMVHKDVWFAFKGDGFHSAAYYKMKWPDCNIVNYNFFSEVFVGMNQIDYRERDWTKAKKFLCLNRALKPFRAEIVWRLYSSGMMDEVNASLVETLDGDEVAMHSNRIFLPGGDKHPEENYEVIRRNDFGKWFNHLSEANKENLFNFLKTKLPMLYDSDTPDVGPYMNNYQKHYNENMMYIVTESSMSSYDGEVHMQQDISEKIFKPMILKMPFIHIGDPFVLSRLREAGFKTFHDFWDESYDEDPISQDRLEKVFSIIKRLYKMPRDQFIRMMKECERITEHNFRRLRDLSENEELYKEFLPRERISGWTKIG